MGCDIHYVIERKDIKNIWHSVMSDAYATEHYFGENIYLSPKRMEYRETPIISLAMRSYSLFAVLSQVRGNERGASIANPGVPVNRSKHAYDYLIGNENYHSFGYFTLGEIKSDVASEDPEIFGATPDGLFAVRNFLQYLIATISVKEGLSEILYAPVYDSTDQHFEFPYSPMLKLSSHQKLRMMDQSAALCPVGDDTVRILVGYDS